MKNVNLMMVATMALFSGALAQASEAFVLPSDLTEKLASGQEVNLRLDNRAEKDGGCFSPRGQRCFPSYDWGTRQPVCICYGDDQTGGGGGA